MIREVKRDELPACADLIRKSFQTVADEFGFTKENAPRFTAFATTEERLIRHMDEEHRLMYLDEEGGTPRIQAQRNRRQTAPACNENGRGARLCCDEPGHSGGKHRIAEVV